METTAFDFTAWGLAADWPALRWIEPIHGRRGQPVRGVRLGHADDSAMVLTCTYPRARFDSEAMACGFDPVREIAFETTYTQVNLALHQLREPAERPDGWSDRWSATRIRRRTDTATGLPRSGESRRRARHGWLAGSRASPRPTPLPT